MLNKVLLKFNTRRAFLLTPFLLMVICGLILRLWYINFGLPHSFYADEPELAEPAIKYTYEIKNIIRNNDVYKLIPTSYVYGTFPVYFYTGLTMVFSKTLGMMSIEFSKADIYIFLRIINALIGLALIPAGLSILRTIADLMGYGNKRRRLLSLLYTFLLLFNWKLIVHSHYLNHDLLIAVLLLASSAFFIRYLCKQGLHDNPELDTKYTILSALFLGLATGTKITCLLTFPIYVFFFLKHKAYRNLVAFSFIIFGVFLVTNPFSWVFADDFVYRLMQMRQKEAGLVFDSINLTYLKYFAGLSYMLTLPIFLLATYYIMWVLRKVRVRTHPALTFLMLQIILYICFYSVQTRRVDRWLLPIIPIMLIFASLGFVNILAFFKQLSKRRAFPTLLLPLLAGGFTLVILCPYLYYPYLLTKQFKRNTPKSEAYIWSQKNLPDLSSKYVITEEGLDPMSKLLSSRVSQFNNYEAQGGQFSFPDNPGWYNYVIVSSRPMNYWKHPLIKEKFPAYYEKWANFEEDLKNMKLIMSFEHGEPNLIPLSSVYIYENPNEVVIRGTKE